MMGEATSIAWIQCPVDLKSCLTNNPLRSVNMILASYNLLVHSDWLVLSEDTAL